jgi:hypothetical protein
VNELQSPVLLTSLAKQRAIIDQLFPATQTGLQLEMLLLLQSAQNYGVRVKCQSRLTDFGVFC